MRTSDFGAKFFIDGGLVCLFFGWKVGNSRFLAKLRILLQLGYLLASAPALNGA